MRSLLALLFFALAPGSGFGSDLIGAAYEDDAGAVARCLEEGAGANSKNRYGVSALSLACQNGNGTIVDLLLKAGADPDTTLPGGETALMTAARTGRVDPVRSLLARGAAVTPTDRKDKTR